MLRSHESRVTAGESSRKSTLHWRAVCSGRARGSSPPSEIDLKQTICPSRTPLLPSDFRSAPRHGCTALMPQLYRYDSKLSRGGTSSHQSGGSRFATLLVATPTFGRRSVCLGRLAAATPRKNFAWHNSLQKPQVLQINLPQSTHMRSLPITSGERPHFPLTYCGSPSWLTITVPDSSV